MADKAYYEVEGTILVPVKIKVALTVRTETGSEPGKAVRAWLQKGKITGSHGDIEDVQIQEVTFPDGIEDTEQVYVTETVFDDPKKWIEINNPKKTKIELIDAK